MGIWKNKVRENNGLDEVKEDLKKKDIKVTMKPDTRRNGGGFYWRRMYTTGFSVCKEELLKERRRLKFSLQWKWRKLGLVRQSDSKWQWNLLIMWKKWVRGSGSLRIPGYYLLTWSRDLLKKLTGSQLVKKFPQFYVIRKFITVFVWPRSGNKMIK